MEKQQIRYDDRHAEVSRMTGETDIGIKLNLDGSGEAQIDTGIGFLDHMLYSFARHGMFDHRRFVCRLPPYD